MTSLTVDEKFDKLKRKHDQIAERMKSLKAKGTTQKRKDENHKKFLTGAYFLEKIAKEGTEEEFKEGMDRFLIRNKERALFGLPEIEEKKEKRSKG